MRIKEVCQALDYVNADGNDRIRCAIESVCDPWFDNLVLLLHGMLPPPDESLVPCG